MTAFLSRKFYCLLPAIFLGWVQTYCQYPGFRHYNTDHGVAGSNVYYTMQDKKGYMWFCTSSGVNRFDGRQFETFTVAHGLADNENFKCFEDEQGRIWFLSYNGKLSYFKDTGFFNGNNTASLRFPDARAIIDMEEGPDKNIWFSDVSGRIYRFDGKVVRVCDDPLPRWGHYPLFCYRNKMYTFYHQGTAGYLYCLTTHKREALYEQSGGSWSVDFICKQTDKSGAIYFTTNDGLKFLRNDSMITAVANKDLRPGRTIGSFSFADNDLWLCSGKDGLLQVPGFLTKGFNGLYREVPGSEYTSGITTDKEGGLWATSLSDGIFYRLASQPYVYHTPGRSITSIGYHGNGLLAIGDYKGCFSIYRQGVLLVEKQVPSSAINRIKRLKWLSERLLLVGCDLGAYCFDLESKSLSKLVGEEQLSGFNGVDMRPYGTWIAGRSTILLYKDKQAKLVYGKTNYTDMKIIGIAGEGPESCWFANIKELYHLDVATGIARKTAGDESFHSNISDLLWVKDKLWVATDGNGIFILHRGKIIKHLLGAQAGTDIRNCKKLACDNNNAVWVATNQGVKVYDASSFHCIATYSLENDMLPGNDIKDMDLNAGKAVIATHAAVSMVDVQPAAQQVAAPQIHIRAINTQQYSQGMTPPAFNYAKEAVTVFYTAVAFRANKSLVYRYTLNGNDASWHETATDRLEFYNLGPGAYTVSIQARTYNSPWSAPAVCRFTILPAWYQTWWFRIMVVAGVAGLLLVWVRRIRHREAQKTYYSKRIAGLRSDAIASQMNPHFIFNTLNSLQALVLMNKPLEANDYIAKFSRLIRWIMHYSDNRRITLDKEIEFLKTYVELEQMRGGAPFDLVIDIDEALVLPETFLPSLVIQPFVENAIKHGLNGAVKQGLLQISFRGGDHMLTVTVQDNGKGREAVKRQQAMSYERDHHESTAIKNTEERLRLISGASTTSRLINIVDLYEDNLPAGTKVIIRIPLLK